MARNSPYRLLLDIGVEGAMFSQKSELKDSADLSKNLVGAEYGKVMEKPKRRGVDVCRCVAVVVLAGLAAWLLGLTLVRELQLAKMSRDMASLRSDLETLRSQVESLNKHVEEEKNLVNDLNVFEDGVFADLDNSLTGAAEDDGSVSVRMARPHSGPPPAPVGRVDLDSITTVLEGDDEDDMYEEDGEDSEDGESGWYEDYDHGRSKVGTTDMMHLRPDDFLGKVLNARPQGTPDRNSKINELRRMLNQDNDAPAPLAPTHISTTTIAASLEKIGSVEERPKRSVQAQPPPVEESLDEFAAPRFYSKIDERRKSKKYDPEGTLTLTTLPSLHPVPAEAAAEASSRDLPRHTRNSDDEEQQGGTPRRAFVAAHFHGNTSHLNPDIHEHYKGNGLVRVAHDSAHNVWSPSDWTRSAPASSPELTRRGHVRVRHTGIYFVYVQIYYLDAHDITGWVLHRTSADGDEEREPLLQCATTSPSSEPRDKPNSCYSAAAILLREGDRLAVRNTGGDRHSLMQKEKSFIGLIKLADADQDTTY